MSSFTRNNASTSPTKPRLGENKAAMPPKSHGADCSKQGSPSDGQTSPKSKIAHRLSASFIPPRPPKSATLPSGSGRTSAFHKLSDTTNTANKTDKSLSTIVKAKNKKATGLPVSWRAELYGTRPGSAQARLEKLCANLRKEVEEQKKTKPVRSLPTKRPATDRESPRKKKVTSQTSTTSSAAHNSVIITATATVTTTTVAERLVKPLNIESDTSAVRATSAVEKLEECNEMDVDDVEMNSPVPVALVSPTVAVTMDHMECDNLAESKRQAKVSNVAVPSTNDKQKLDKKEDTDKKAHDEANKSLSDLKTKYKEGLSAFSSYFYCIIDTNIFIEHYKNFQGFLSKKYSGRQPIVVIPYKVLHELDTVKHKKPELASKIVPVVKFLHQMLRAKDARVKGQHPWDDTIELMPVLSPDDSIINCALQVQTVAESSDNVKVVLVSNDCNMLTKALVANLNSCTMEELQSDYKF
uniref:PINc domain-containing protein n=1 Tax=Anopheles epiroticus TaxID=199890 RepID=A0A182PKJ7_9DIPT